MSPRLVLASASPRRRELLAGAGLVFEVVPSAVPEVQRTGESPAAFARRLAHDKASDVAARRPGCCVLGADTIVVVDDTTLGKPEDRNQAQWMLQQLSGRAHRVLTAVVLIDPGGRREELVVESVVEFRVLEHGEIEDYLDSGEPFDKAGAYAVQGLARRFVTSVRGSYSNVIGLPMDEVVALLQRHLPVPAGPTAGDP
jgi:septum formation protein